MTGEQNLQMLLRGMKPEMKSGVFVFCSIPDEREIPLGIKPIHIFRESEGISLILPREDAEKMGLSFQFPSRQITLTIHSSLDAVGFLAAIAGHLANAGISLNAVSAFYHDHLFVPVGMADEAMGILHRLARESLSESGS